VNAVKDFLLSIILIFIIHQRSAKFLTWSDNWMCPSVWFCRVHLQRMHKSCNLT